jgi:hypothetical protein
VVHLCTHELPIVFLSARCSHLNISLYFFPPSSTYMVLPRSQNKCSFALFTFNVWPFVLFENFLWLVFLLLLDDKTWIVLYVWLNIFKFFTKFSNKTDSQTLGTNIYNCTYFKTEVVINLSDWARKWRWTGDTCTLLSPESQSNLHTCRGTWPTPFIFNHVHVLPTLIIHPFLFSFFCCLNCTGDPLNQFKLHHPISNK